MSNLKDLVPDLELCKKIPAGEFEDSAFVWVVNGDYQPKFQIVDKRKYPFIPEDGATLYPAPTTDEILAKCKDIPRVLNPTLWWQGIWKVDCAIDKSGKLSDEFFEDADIDNLDLVCAEDKQQSTAALKLWLKLSEPSEVSEKSC
jgi:hypothetical protein